jgi:signal transduction histidine kinase
MLYRFIVTNREVIIDRARQRVRLRAPLIASEDKLERGVPLFLTELVRALAPLDGPDDPREVRADLAVRQQIIESAARYGHELLRNGFSVAQVVHGYGDVCQVVTELAGETDAAIGPEDFQVFNQCLDDAIAGAVTAYGRQREQDLAQQGMERMGVFAHELRNLLGTAMLSFDVIKNGTVGLGGSTGAIHARSLSRLHALVERSLSEVRLEAGVPLVERVSLLEFIEELVVSARMQAEANALHLTVLSAEGDATVDVDRQLLASAVSNLLQNAFKYTHPHGNVVLATRLTEDRVLIDVSDECGGLPPGKAEQLFRPFVRGGADRSGLGLGLWISLNAVRANSGELRVRDIPGKGCVFTIDLPRVSGPPALRFPALLD